MDIDDAIHYGFLVAAAYGIATSDLKQRAGECIKKEFDTFDRKYKVVSTIYGNDLGTKLHDKRAFYKVSYGFVLQDAEGNVVIPIRGTDGILEWLHDSSFLQHPCPFLRGAGNTEDGFTSIYQTLSIDPDYKTSVKDGLKTLQFDQPIKSITLCGHSLGGALVTLLALDIAGNTDLDPNVFSYASPRTGDQLFADTFNSLVKTSYRIANELDVVPKLPLEHPMPPLPNYRHVDGLYSLNGDDVSMTIRCEHILPTYQYLLGKVPGIKTPSPPIEPTCSFKVTDIPEFLELIPEFNPFSLSSQN